MKRSEKIVTAILTMVFGVLLIALQDRFIGILMTIGGVCLLTLGAMDILQRFIPPAVIKIVSGILIIICGWALVEAVLYVIAAILLVACILLLYDKIRKRATCETTWQTVLAYALPAVGILIGCLLLFHQAFAIELIFIISGALTVIEGGMLLVEIFYEE